MCSSMRNPGLKFPSSTMGALAFSTVLPASPPLIALKTVSGFTPAFVARTRASDMAAMFSATMIWLASFVTLPLPIPPQYTADDPIFSRMSFTCSKTSGFPADHDRQRPVDRLGLAAGHRGIQHLHALGRQRRGDLPSGRRRDGAHVDEDGTAPGTFDDAVRPERHLPHVRGVGEHRDHQLAAGGDIRGGGARFRPVREGLRQPIVSHVVDHELIDRPS